MSHVAAYSGKQDPINCPANQPKNEANPECIMDLKTWLFFFKNCDSPEDKRKAAEQRLALVKEMRARPKGWTTNERKMLYKEQGRLEAMLSGKVLRPRNEVHPRHAHIERNRYGKMIRP